MATILILEDEPLIALDIEGVLQENGLDSVITLATCSSALAWLGQHIPSVAIVDPRLSDGVCDAVARHLVQHGIPFIVHSGDASAVIEVEPAFGMGEILIKPSLPEVLLEAVERALRSVSLHALPPNADT